MIYICEQEFVKPDGKSVDYAFAEIDIYHWVPVGSDVENHRLTLFKNLKTEEYELHRVYKKLVKLKIVNFGVETISHILTGEVDIIFKNKDLEVVVVEANGLWMKYHGKWSEQKNGSFAVCKHKHPKQSILCGADEKTKTPRYKMTTERLN